MWFNLVLSNHGTTASSEYLTPLIAYMRGALSKCGHETTVVQTHLYPSAINILFEYFPVPAYVSHLLEIRAAGSLKIGVVATELIVDGTIPYAKHGMPFNTEQVVRDRIAGFDVMAREVDFLWSWLQRTADEYRTRCRVSEFFPVGHVWRQPKILRSAPKDIDVLFFGLNTPHRAAIVEELRAQGIQVACFGRGFPSGYVTQTVLHSMMDRAKIGLNLNLHSRDHSIGTIDPRFASCMRITEMLDRELCVVSEEIPLDNPYDRYMHYSEPALLARTCKELLDSGLWRAAGEEASARFRKEMAVELICMPVIDRTLASIA